MSHPGGAPRICVGHQDADAAAGGPARQQEEPLPSPQSPVPDEACWHTLAQELPGAVESQCEPAQPSSRRPSFLQPQVPTLQDIKKPSRESINSRRSQMSRMSKLSAASGAPKRPSFLGKVVNNVLDMAREVVSRASSGAPSSEDSDSNIDDNGPDEQELVQKTLSKNDTRRMQFKKIATDLAMLDSDKANKRVSLARRLTAGILNHTSHAQPEMASFTSQMIFWVHSPEARLLLAFIAVLNAAVVAAETDHGSDNIGWVLAKAVFLLIFGIELFLVRASRKRLKGLRLLDAALLLLLTIDLVLSVSGQRHLEWAGSLLQVARVSQTLRVLRLFSLFRDLQLLALGLAGALKALRWTVILIFIVLYVCAVVITETMRHGKADGTEETTVELFGTVAASLFTLFGLMSIEGWPENVRKVMAETSNHAWVFFLPFMMFMNWVLLNLVMAVVVEKVFQIAQREALKEAEKQEQQRVQTLRKLRDLFNDMDEDGNGTLDMDEFHTALKDEHVLAQFIQLGIAQYEAHDLFQCLDVDGNQELSVEEFVDGCFRMTGAAKAKHLLAVHYDLHRSRKVLREGIKELQLEMVKLGQTINPPEEGLVQVRSNVAARRGKDNHLPPQYPKQVLSNRLGVMEERLQTLDHTSLELAETVSAMRQEVSEVTSKQAALLEGVQAATAAGLWKARETTPSSGACKPAERCNLRARGSGRRAQREWTSLIHADPVAAFHAFEPEPKT